MHLIDDVFQNNRTKFVIFDFETLSQVSKPVYPIELGAVMLGLDLQQHDFSFSEFIKPGDGHSLHVFDTQLTGITPTDVQDAMDAHTVLQHFDTKISKFDCILVAHNAYFDYSVIKQFRDQMPYTFSRPVIDTIKLARYLLPEVTQFKLHLLAEYLGVTVPPKRHRGLIDAQITLEVLIQLLLEFQRKEINNLSSIIKRGWIKKWETNNQLPLL